jgi:tyrosyl-tRNA synthetase
MSAFKSDLMQVLTERGFIQQCSDAEALDRLAAAGPVTGYIGFDCTAPSLHVGSLVQIMALHWMQQTGHRPIVLMGGGTTRVGDPSGKDEMRQLLAPETIEANKAGIRRVFDRFIRFGDGATDSVMVDNAEWLLSLNYVDFLREVGRHISVNQMIQREAIKLRLDREHHLSFLEFNYMVLQAYDFVELARRYGCRLQLGGSDQWGNIVAGVDLGRRLDGFELFALTTPLITTAAGAKMGKTAAGAVWLDGALLSPYEYWQFWRNTHDADVGRFLRLFTTLSLDEVARLEALADAEVNEAKKVLANETTALLHGKAAAAEAAEAARRTFEEGGLAEALPTVTVPASELAGGIGVLALFVRAGLVASNGEARRQIRGGGLRLNDVAIADERATVSSEDVRDGVVKLSLGRKKHVLVRPA